MEDKLFCNPVLAGDLYIHGLGIFHVCIQILNRMMIIFNKLFINLHLAAILDHFEWATVRIFNTFNQLGCI